MKNSVEVYYKVYYKIMYKSRNRIFSTDYEGAYWQVWTKVHNWERPQFWDNVSVQLKEKYE